MKLNGIIGKGTGKLGSSVFAISGGEQIVREYNPVVSNPNTDAQIAQRAKLKLMSQLAAALAPALAFKKKGLVSARNQFVSKNIGLASYADDTAEVNLFGLQLTDSRIEFPALTGTISEAGVLSVNLREGAAADIKRVACVVYKKTDDDQLSYIASKVVEEAGENRTFPTTFQVGQNDVIVYAYGIKDENTNATIRYEEYVADMAGNVAVLDVVKLFTTSGYNLTATVGAEVEV